MVEIDFTEFMEHNEELQQQTVQDQEAPSSSPLEAQLPSAGLCSSNFTYVLPRCSDIINVSETDWNRSQEASSSLPSQSAKRKLVFDAPVNEEQNEPLLPTIERKGSRRIHPPCLYCDEQYKDLSRHLKTKHSKELSHLNDLSPRKINAALAKIKKLGIKKHNEIFPGDSKRASWKREN